MAIVDVEEIDQLNIYHAGLLAMRRAVEGLEVRIDHALVDGRVVPDVEWSQTRIVGGDAEELSIAAASILAKVTRDRIMAQLDVQYPGYALAVHQGYPTRVHQEALARLGPAPCHRMSFEAVLEFSGQVSDAFRAWRERLDTIQTESMLRIWRAELRGNVQLTDREKKRLRGLASRKKSQGHFRGDRRAQESQGVLFPVD